MKRISKTSSATERASIDRSLAEHASVSQVAKKRFTTDGLATEMATKHVNVILNTSSAAEHASIDRRPAEHASVGSSPLVSPPLGPQRGKQRQVRQGKIRISDESTGLRVCKHCSVFEPFQNITDECCMTKYGVQCIFDDLELDIDRRAQIRHGAR